MGDYDEDTAFLGQKGPYFLLILFVLNSIYISGGLTSLNIVFVGSAVPHRCWIPDGNLSEAWRNASIPTELVNGQVEQSRCSRYRLDLIRNLSALGYNPQDTNLTDIQQEHCVDGWTYSKDIYQSTIITEWDLVCDNEWKAPFATSTLYMGYLLGSLVSGQLSDRFGRKKVIFISLAGQFFFVLFESFSPSWEVFCVTYFFVGAFQISIYISAFVLGTEVLSKSMRVIFTSFGAFLHYSIGYMLLPGIAYAVRDWRPLLQIITSVCVMFLPLWWLIPESPRWLLSQGRVEEAEAILRDAARRNKVTAPEVVFKGSELENVPSETKTYSIFDVLKTNNVRCVTFMCGLLWIAGNIGYFGLTLNTSNLSGNPFLNCFLSAATEVPAYVAAVWLLKKCPRRIILSTFLIIGGACLLSIQLISEGLRSLAVTLEMVGKFGFTISYTVVYVYTAEVYPTVLRALGIGICSSAARLGSITAPYIIYLGNINKYLPYILMGSITIGLSIANIFLPETFGEELPETIQQMQKCRGYVMLSTNTTHSPALPPVIQEGEEECERQPSRSKHGQTLITDTQWSSSNVS